MFVKAKVCLVADKLLCNFESFKVIMEKTGWSKQEVFDYIRSSFINEYPNVYKKNVSYFTWGMTNEELEKYNEYASSSHKNRR